MDVWVFAVAAGAGYVARQLKNLNRSRCNSFDLSSGNHNFDSLCASTLKAQESLGQELFRRGKPACNDASEAASTSGYEGDGMEMADDLNCSGGVLNNEDNKGDWEDRMHFNGDEVVNSDSRPQPSSADVGICCGFRRNKSSRVCRGIRSKIMKPQTSLESCLMAQLYKEHAKFEEYICSVDRPTLGTNGSRNIVSQESCSMTSETVRHEICDPRNPEGSTSVVGIPRLPNVVPTELRNRAKAKPGTEHVSAKLVNGNENDAQGLSDGACQFYIGLTMGIMYSFLGSKWEIEKLRESLAQTENLVQDLQEELDMKDALTVKELAIEDHESLDVQNDSHVDDKQDDTSRNYADEESLRKIEAELEAELDMLESNINSSRVKGQLLNLAKLNPNLVSDVIEGELRADLFGVKVGSQAYADKDGSNCSTPRYAQYPVSPRELSLRLHEVIQSRLEQRVRELEVALQHSQKSSNKIETSTNPGSPVAPHSTDQPVIISLSAYNDAYEESAKLSESDEEESTNGEEIFHLNGQMGPGLIFEGNQEMVVKNDGFSSRDESEEDDEMEKLLIRQIVEKAKQGSPAFVRARRALLSSS